MHPAHRRLVTVALAALMILSLPALAVPTLADDGTDRDVVTIDSDHDLATNDSVSDFEGDGYASTELSQLDARLTVATDGDDVGLEDHLLPTSVRNDFVRLEYREDFSRTLRIHVPRDYWVPYSQAEVRSATSDHVAEYEPVRGGEYLQIVVHVDEPTDIVLPIQKDSSMGYRAVERLDRQIERATGHTFFSGDEWSHLRGDELTADMTYELEGVEDSDDVVVQYDAHKDDPEETWINAPDGDDESVGVHTITQSSDGNETVSIVATVDDPPDVRYKIDGGPQDRAEGWINDAKEIPNRVQDLLGDAWPLSTGVAA